MRGGQALIITEPWGLNETRLSPTVYFPGHVHVAINVGGGGTNNHIALIQADKNVHKTGIAFKCAVICNKRGDSSD